MYPQCGPHHIYRENKEFVPHSQQTELGSEMLLITVYWVTVCELPEKSTGPFSSAQLGISEKTQMISNAIGISNSTKAVHTMSQPPFKFERHSYFHYTLSSCLSSTATVRGCCVSSVSRVLAESSKNAPASPILSPFRKSIFLLRPKDIQTARGGQLSQGPPGKLTSIIINHQRQTLHGDQLWEENVKLASPPTGPPSTTEFFPLPPGHADFTHIQQQN